MRKLKAFTLTEIVVAILVITVVLTATLSITKSKMEKVDKYYYYMAFSIAKDISQNIVGQMDFALPSEEADSGLSKFAYNFNKFLLSKFQLKSVHAASIFGVGSFKIEDGTRIAGCGIAGYDWQKNPLTGEYECMPVSTKLEGDFVQVGGGTQVKEDGGEIDTSESGLTNSEDPAQGSDPESDPETEPESEPTPDPASETPTEPTPETPAESEPETPSLSTAADLCGEIVKMYNVAQSDCSIEPWAYSQARVSGDFSNVTPQIVLNNGLRLFIASDFKEIPQLASEDVNALEKDRQGFVLYVDSNGGKAGKNRLDSDIFVFYLLKSGKMVPDRGPYAVNSPTGPDSTDSLSVNVLYDDFSSGNRVLKTLMHGVDYRTAACASGTVISATYCTKPDGSVITKNAACGVENDCRIKINKPMRKLF